jgi:hypothetical protein
LWQLLQFAVATISRFTVDPTPDGMKSCSKLTALMVWRSFGSVWRAAWIQMVCVVASWPGSSAADGGNVYV